MSLVNDVLRQLDANSVKPCQAMPLHSLMIEQPAKKNKLIGMSFILLVCLLFSVITIQIFYKKSLVDIFYFNDLNRVEVSQQSWLPPLLNRSSSLSKNDIANKNSNVHSNDITASARLLIAKGAIERDGTLKEAINSRLIASKSIDSEIVNISTLKVNSAPDTLEIDDDRLAIVEDSSRKNIVKKDGLLQGAEVKDIEKQKNQENKIAVKENDYQTVSIIAVKNIGFKHYQLSLRAYKNKQTSAALSWIDLALAVEKKDEYLRLKVRILMQKGDRNELHRFVLTQSDNTSLDWFQLIAPSLQMYAYYNLSNEYYSELIKLQPNDVKWPLAMALNYSKLEQNEKTYLIYKDLLNSSLLSYQQQRWITKRLGRIEQGKVVIDER